MSQSSQLAELVESLKRPEHYGWSVEYVPRKGWYLFPDEARSLEENGEYMGYTFAEAKKGIEFFLGSKS